MEAYLSLSLSRYSLCTRSSMRFLMSLKSGLNIRCNCCTHSSVSCWCWSVFLLFIMRTIAASTACLRSCVTTTEMLRVSTLWKVKRCMTYLVNVFYYLLLFIDGRQGNLNSFESIGETIVKCESICLGYSLTRLFFQ